MLLLETKLRLGTDLVGFFVNFEQISRIVHALFHAFFSLYC